MSNQIRVKILPFAIAALLACSSAHAQNTSSAVTGQVVDAQGKPVAGATVTIVNVPSGTTRVVTTDAMGNYNAQGLRVGGPFDITVKKDGMETSEKNGIYLKLAETSTLDFSIGVRAKELGAVTVTAAAMNTLFQPENRGLTTNVTQREIDTLPATGRSLQDYVRLDPMVNVNASGGISALGQNSRYNNINIDAVPTNDPFGLEAGGMPSLGQPISIDTISEINVSTNNYDVTNAHNVGAQINAVTKSGTNQFHGDVYYVYLPKQWVGNGASDTPFTGFTKNTTAGFTLGGPIIKDKLFFFVAYEDQKSTAPAPDIGIIGSGKGSIVPITQAQLDQIAQIAQGYGFATGSSQLGAPNTDEKRYLAKFDWNINNNHRIEFRYDRTKSNLAVISARGGSGGYVNLASANYSQLRDFKNYVINTYDDWSDTFSSETSVSYGSYLRAPLLNGPLSPQVQVYVNGTSGPSVYMGTNYSYQANNLDTKTWTGFWAGTLFLNDHTVKFGVDFLRNNYNNLFLQYYAGGYLFTSIANFQAGNYSFYQLRQPSSGNLADASAIWSYDNWGFFAQDVWQINDALNLQYGLRWDVPRVPTAPAYNAFFTQTFGLRNNSTINGHSVLEPRLSFNYTFDTARPTQLRGGIGLFMGATPAVWQSNPFTNNGINVTTYTAYNPATGGPLSSNPYNQPRPATNQPKQTVDLLSSNFQQPTVLKTSLALDHELPWWGMVASAEISYVKDQEAIYYQNLNLGAPTTMGPDGRPIFFKLNGNGTICTTSSCSLANANPKFSSVMYLDNTTQGSATYTTLRLQHPGDEDGFGWSLAWTHGRASSVNPGSSSVAYSNWRYSPSVNPNGDVAYNTNFNVRNRLGGYLAWSHKFYRDYRTSFGAYLNVASGTPYSWVYGNDANGDAVYYNDLVYVPTGPGDVEFTSNTSAQLQQQFFNYIKSQPGLSKYAGHDVPRNGSSLPWTHQLDLRISQEIPGLFEGNKGEVVLDIYNFLNMLDKNWGQLPALGYDPQTRNLANFAGIDPATGKYIYDLSRYADANGNYAPQTFGLLDGVGSNTSKVLSRWSVQMTVRYKF
ncbi:TonB-dependent receptor [Metallibacterium sp.]|jgi:hypothetical protein|uniref:TonB-dependent receptor n=1 Tax=Metallibacterium sp. TaxID=2940281 RepID=UPI002639640E|nr:TonB-dependent receptor [Metallibacterium sp.]